MGGGNSKPEEELVAEVEELRKQVESSGAEKASLEKRVSELSAGTGGESAGRTPTEFDPYLFPDLSSTSQNRSNKTTITEYIITHTKNDQELAMLMNSIQHACKVVSNAIEKAGPAGLYGLAGQENATGDDVKKLDIIANDIWVECLSRSGVCSLLVSEEDEEAIVIKDANKRGPFCCAF
eukprot:CAMPEP_0197876156 /NCGR_PEP_ID=MMETSP1439-20131203/5207_1 /TAXON_ID=66791 /ORGANISM="Gonyaulax spinifera, Strain CCMP409" /LENGTH=179 /DNA_ID=CAMNT_0043495427 /DNA_START=84 /DNA_END=620 /DNA_ORIENTATION=+